MTWESLGWRVYSEGCGGQLSITGPAKSGVFNVFCMERGGRLTMSERVAVQSRLSMEACDPSIFAGPAIDSMGVALSPGRLPADMLCHPSGPMADRRRFTREGSISCTPSPLPSVSHATGHLVHTLPCKPSRAHLPLHTSRAKRAQERRVLRRDGAFRRKGRYGVFTRDGAFRRDLSGQGGRRSSEHGGGKSLDCAWRTAVRR